MTDPATLSVEPAATGPLMFARYAFAPNRLGYCGPEDWRALAEGAAAGDAREVRALALGFEGAYPYLELIAASNGIADPLDARVVEAYWLGNSLLHGVVPATFGQSLESRFRTRIGRTDWRWIAAKPSDGALPLHAFHVLEVFPRIGLLRSGATDGALAVMDACRIRPGRVLEASPEGLRVATQCLELVDGQLRLGASHVEMVSWGIEDRSSPAAPTAGEAVSLHWGRICDRLSSRQLAALQRSTRAALQLANRTL